MSLHNLAHHLQSAGRGEDKVLVHMTPGEVKGLQSLAMAQGGSLTVNPQTGLPEAGILSSLLPMIAGFALGPAGLGMTALNAGLTTAAIGTAASGSLKKGLMAGLGAYSGAGLGAGLQSMAAPATAPAVPGLSPSVAANTSALGGTSQFANVGAENVLTSADDLLMQGAKNVPTGFNPRASMVFSDASKLSGPPPVDAAKFVGGARPPADTYFDPSRAYNPSGSLSGSRAAADVKGFGAQRVYGPEGLLGKTKVPTVDVVGDQIVPYNPALTPSASVPAAAPTPVNRISELSAQTRPTSLAEMSYAPGMEPVTPNMSYALNQRSVPGISGRSEILPGDISSAQPRSISEPFRNRMAELGRGAKASFGSIEGLKGLHAASEAAAPYGMYAGLGSTAYSMYEEERKKAEEEARRRAAASQGMIRPYEFSYGATNVSGEPYTGSAERTYFQPTYTAGTPYKAPGPEYAADGGLMGYAAGGPIEQMAAQNAVGQNTGYPMANLQTPMYSNPGMQRPEATNVIAPSADAGVGAYSGEQRFAGGGETQYGVASHSNYVNPEIYNRSQYAGGNIPALATATATPQNQSSGYTYSYDPATMQFTQTGSPSNGATATTGFRGVINKLFNKAGYEAPNRIGSDSNLHQVTGGVAGIPIQPSAPAQSFAPTITVPAYQTPEQQLGLGGFYDYMNQQMRGYGGYAAGGNVGGMSHLGDYSDGGRLLKGPGDGVSDSIPASIGNRQPARLADGEFVVPARIVSEIGNGSTEAGARKLYAMMDRVQRARRKTTGKNQVAANTKAEKLLPA